VAEKGVNSYYVGQKAIDQLKFSHPYERGLVNSWEDMEAVWEYCFSHCLEVDTSSTKVFLTEAHMPPKLQRETTVETMFELFNVDATFLHVQPVLALFAAGLTSGVVIDSGEHSTTIYPVADGYHVMNASKKLNFGGFQMNKVLSHLLQENTNNVPHVRAVLSNTSGTGVVSTIKEVLTSVRSKSEPCSTGNIKYTLPDGSQIELNGGGFTECTERFFDPAKFAHIVDGDEPSLQSSVLKSIMSAPMDVRRNLASAVVLTGGNTMFKGLPERLCTELKAIMPGTMSSSLRVIAPSDRCNAIWVGGSILTSLSTFEDRWITGADYDEFGPSIVHKKCSVFL